MRKLLLFLILFAAACSSSDSSTVVIPTLMELPTLTSLPTDTPTSTPTPLPTSTPTISPTATPTITPIPPTNTVTPTSTATPMCDFVVWENTYAPTIVQFFDTAEVAASTPRGSLAPILLELQQVARSFDALIRDSTCESFAEVLGYLSDGMRHAVEGYREFLGQNDSGSDFYFGLANQDFYNANHAEPTLMGGTDYRALLPSLVWGGTDGSDAGATQQSAQYTRVLATYNAQHGATDTPTAPK